MAKPIPPPPAYTFDLVDWKEVDEVLKGHSPVAAGSFAQIYRTHWRGKDVAVKKLKEQMFEAEAGDGGESEEDFKKEVDVHARLRHPHIITLLGAATAPGHHVLILEWCARGSLKDVLYKRTQAFPWALRLKLAYEVAEGLRCMHTNTPKIIHRDIKAENVFLTSDWIAKVGDFGLAKLKLTAQMARREESRKVIDRAAAQAAAKGLTADVRPHLKKFESKIEMDKSGAVGTPAWVAPEILAMKPYNEKADVYSYAIMMWEFSARKQPWITREDYEVMMGVLHKDERPDPPMDCPAPWRALMIECWDTVPEKRPTMGDVSERILKIKDDPAFADPSAVTKP